MRASAATGFVGRTAAVRALLASVKKVARTDATVLVRGESGTGKELIAEALHAASERASGPLVKVNCAALVETLLLSELFGHEKGAFTGAAVRKRGRFERATGGTLFLDEIGDISPRTQVALLRVLEERSIERVGGCAPIPVDVRIVCATNRDLRTLVERGEFREDLYYRLSGITLEIPPLRERLDDLPALCDAIVERIAAERGDAPKRVSAEGLALFARHRWPGNVRELENALRAASVFAEGDEIGPDDLTGHVDGLRRAAEAAPSSVAGRAEPRPSAPPPVLDADAAPTEVAYRAIRDQRVSLGSLKRDIERECIARALADTGGNITRAAAVLGMKRPRLSQLVKQYALLGGAEEDEP
jgi:transcriptional regulator with GAF, ATPase, and Fis domain